MSNTRKQLQLFAWHGEERFLFIATTGGTYDLVKEQPITPQTLEGIRRKYQHLTRIAIKLRKWDQETVQTDEGGDVITSVKDLGHLVKQIILHPDIRRLLSDCEFSEVVISTNEFSIPWELLSVNDSYIALTCPVTRRLQSARPVTQPAQILYRETLKVLLVHNPTGDLLGADKEASEIERLLVDSSTPFEVVKLTTHECTRFRILELLERADIFHYAGHAFFNPERPKESGLQLHDGPLNVSEIENYLSDSAPFLVFLNGCESAGFGNANMVLAGQDMASLAHPFINAGCGAVIGSSLPVGDNQAAYFATKLYESLIDGDLLAVSTWKARKAVAEKFGMNDPTWSSFLLFGDGELRVVIKERIKVNAHDIRSSIAEALEWLRSERTESGHWCDRVYRRHGVMNTAEVILAFHAAGEPLTESELTDGLTHLLQAKDGCYTASPYEPEHLGIFTSCISYVLRALLAVKPFFEHRVELDSISRAITDATNNLLGMQESNGGWSWGKGASGVGAYIVFTAETLEALETLTPDDHVDYTAVCEAMDKGYSFLSDMQRSDGGWSYKEKVATSDAASTCYALCKLLNRKNVAEKNILNGLNYLRSNLDLANLKDSQFFVNHRIEVPGLPRNNWPHFEDYSGLGALCSLLVIAPELESHLGTSGLLETLVEHLLSNKEPGRGWPRTYSTIYVTAYYIEILNSAIDSIVKKN